MSNPRVHVWRNSEVSELLGDLSLDEVIIRDVKTNEHHLSARRLWSF